MKYYLLKRIKSNYILNKWLADHNKRNNVKLLTNTFKS